MEDPATETQEEILPPLLNGIRLLTDKEKAKIAERALEIITEEEFDYTGEVNQRGLASIFGRAMEILPEDRRRIIGGKKEIERLNLLPFLDQRISELSKKDPESQPKMRKKRESKKRIVWAPEEFEMVMTLAASRMKSMGLGVIPSEDDRTGRRMVLEAIRFGQNQMLTGERRRSLNSFANLNDWDIRTLERTLNAKPKSEEAAPGVPVAQSVSPMLPITTANSALDSASLEFVNYIARLGQALTEAQEVNKMLQEDISKISDAQGELLKRMADLENRTNIPVVAMEKAPVVALLGMRKDEFDMIQSEVELRKLKVELKLYEQNEKPRPIKAEFAITMKFISHAWDDHIKEAIPSGQYTFLRGGMSQVIQQLEIWFA